MQARMLLGATFALAVVASEPGVLASGMSAAGGDETPQQLFARQWEHQQVVVRRALYTLVFDERGKLGNTYDGKREGLTVVTPKAGVFLQFDGRQGRGDVVRPQAEDMVDAVRTAYQPDSLELRSYRKVEPIVVHRYDPGVELVIRTVRVGRDAIRIGLAVPGTEPEATSLTVRWPVPFSKAFAEREVVEGLMRWFVDRPVTSAER
jgi:hypothetical protein